MSPDPTPVSDATTCITSRSVGLYDTVMHPCLVKNSQGGVGADTIGLGDFSGGLRGCIFLNENAPWHCLPFSAASRARWPTLPGATVNPVPVHRFLPGTDLVFTCRPAFWPETGAHAFPCIVMQVRRNHQGAFGGIWAGKGAGNGRQAAETH